MNDEALNIFIENKNIALKMNNKGLLEVSLLNIGQTYFNTNQYDSSLIYLDQGIELCNELKTEMYVKHKFWGLFI